MRKLKHYILLFFLCVGYPAYSQSSVSLDSCIAWSLQNYPLIQQLQLIDLSRDYSIDNINTGYIPHANIFAFGGYIDGIPQLTPNTASEPWRFMGAINVEQTIWDGGQMLKNKKLTKTQAEIDKQNIRINLFELRSKVSEIFFGILLIQEQKKEIHLQENNLNQSLKSVETAIKNGTAYYSDLDEVNVALLNLDQKLSQLRALENSYREMLTMFTHRNIVENTVLERPVIQMSLNDSIEKRPELQLFDNQKKLLDAHNPGAGEALPRVSLMGLGGLIAPEFKMNQTSLNHLLMGGLTVTWPIGGRTYTMGMDKKRLSIEKQKIDNQQETFIFNTKLSLSQHASKIRQWDEMLISDEKIVDLRNKIKKSAETKYENGTITMTELLRCINEASLAKQNKDLHEIQKLLTIYQYNADLGY